MRSKIPPLFLALLSTACSCILVRVHSFSPSRHSGPNNSVSTWAMRFSSEASTDNQWKSLEPRTFTELVSPTVGYQYAKDEDYLQAVLEAWDQETTTSVETSPWIYYDEYGTPLYGHVVRPKNHLQDLQDPLRPGILLFHTAAGPQDVFLFQKAATLASSELGCVVLICDVLSDQNGWAWTPDGNRTRFNNVKDELLQNNASLLQSRVEAAVRALLSDGLGVDPTRLAALGWCFGAQPILELAALQQQQDCCPNGKEYGTLAFSASALVSYHGVYRRVASTPAHFSASESKISENVSDREILICTGKDDPFVSLDDLEFAKLTMEEKNYSVRIMEFDGAKHGFTNPAQDFNTNPDFGYDEIADTQSWTATMGLLTTKLSVNSD